jgi:hypothetical protein
MGLKPKMAVVILLLLWEGVEFREVEGWEKGGLGGAACFNREYVWRGGERSG